MINIDEFDSKVIDSQIIDDAIDLINEVKDTDNSKIEVPIKVFNLFVSSNSDYLYNKTYILDLLDKFNKNIKILKEKYSVALSLLEELKSVSGEWFVLVDDYFIITSSYIEGVITYNKVKSEEIKFMSGSKSLEFIDRNIYKFINCNNLFNINGEKHIVRLFISEFNVLFSLMLQDDIKKLAREIEVFIKKWAKGV